nr:DUF4440 domain-containing protein [Listeria weihenstephanensis]
MEMETLKRHLLALEEKLLHADVRGSAAELNKILADGFFEIGSSGRVLYKEEPIAEAGIGEVEMALTNYEIQIVTAEVVLATYRIFDVTKKQHSLRSSLWKFQEDHWQLVFHQGTKSI